MKAYICPGFAQIFGSTAFLKRLSNKKDESDMSKTVEDKLYKWIKIWN